ncbi:MAG: alpha/beta fold hydrolase [Phaeodactylibacter sp.]|nr:alpha/beta fold hydrolase [Phaeodactylibacter sp.]MCB9273190.1 alpha/beta fold hydrolase [Lewinellaceae bacterium]
MASQELVWATTVLLILYGAAILYFVIRGALRTTSISDYAVGSIRFSPVVVGLSLAASITSAATFIINPGFIALYGFSGLLAFAIVMPLGIFFSLAILTKSFRKHGASVQALTMAQWIGKRYGSNGYALFFGFLSLLLITFIVLICVGMTKVMAKALNADELYILIGLAAFVFGYMMFGGANSMVYTNTIQAILMLIVAFILLGSGYEHFSQGVHGFIDKLAAIDPYLVKAVNPNSFLFRDYFEIVFCNLVVGVAIVCQPHIITKSLLLKEERDVNRYLATGILVEAIFFSVVLAGLYARLRFPDLTADGQPLKMDGIIPAYVVTEFPVFVGLIVIMGLLSAGLSTLEGLIQSVSTTITSDIIGHLAGPRLGEGERRTRRLIAINKVVIVFLAVVSIWLSYGQLAHPSLSVGIFAQNGVYAYFSAAFVPVLLGIYFRDVPKAAPVAASATAVLVHFGTYYGRLSWYMQAEVRNPAIAATYAILASLVVGVSLYYLLRKRRQAGPAAQGPVEAHDEVPAAKAAPGPQQYTQHTATLSDGIEIGYMACGEGPRTLLFLHGLASNYKGWVKLATALSGHYRCIAMDFPGYATSGKGDYPISMAFFAKKAIELAEHLELEKPILVGHSMGGQVALTAVLQRPGFFEKLVLIAPAGFETFNHTGHQWLRNLYSPALIKATSVEQTRSNFEANFFQFPSDAEFMIDDRLDMRRNVKAFDYFCQLIPRCVAAMLDEPVFSRLPQAKLPTLILFGQNDLLIPNKMLNPTLTTRLVGEIGAGQIEGSQLTMLSNCGHFAQWECADAVAGAIREFVG